MNSSWILLIGSSEFHAAQAQYIRGGSELNGCFLNFVLSGKEAVFTKPTSYDLRTIADLEKEYASVSLSESKKTTIIVIMDESFADLSGGQQQRVLLARALCATDKIIFLDEPITGLDPIASKDFYALIEKLNKELGITIIMITHDVENALKYSNKILHMHKYKYFFGNKAEYLIDGGCTEECMCEKHQKGGK